MGDIYVSTLAFTGKNVEEIIGIAEDQHLFLEFSSGMPYNANMADIYVHAGVKRLAHNYFPAPKVPFVLNLASTDRAIHKLSVNHCLNGLALSKKSGASFFAAHAGFCIDPRPEELGEKIKYNPVFDKNANMEIFLDSLRFILREAEKLDMQFFFENNVIAGFNMADGKNPLLCCESTEIAAVINEINNERLGLLLDTAHLKVSCHTLGLDKDAEATALIPYIKAIHHSDNDGLKDTNEPMNETYWFLRHLKQLGHLPQVVEVKNIGLEQINSQLNLLQAYGG